MDAEFVREIMWNIAEGQCGPCEVSGPDPDGSYHASMEVTHPNATNLIGTPMGPFILNVATVLRRVPIRGGGSLHRLSDGRIIFEATMAAETDF